MMPDEVGTLPLGEPHPIAYDAQEFISKCNPIELGVWQESFASTALAGNKLGEVCGETLRRLINGEPVSDRYLLGLAFVILHAEYTKMKIKEG